MQPDDHQNESKYDHAARKSCQDTKIPFLMPGKFSGEKIKDYCKHESNNPIDEQEYPSNIVPGLVELTQVPAVTHQDDRHDGKRECFKNFHFQPSLWDFGEYTPLGKLVPDADRFHLPPSVV
jgi:hypothetical protein